MAASAHLGMRIDPELHAWLVAEAEAQGRTPSYVARELIKHARLHGLPTIPVRPPSPTHAPRRGRRA